MQQPALVPRFCRRCGFALEPERTSWAKEGVGAAWSCTACGAVRFEARAQKPKSTEIIREDAAGLGGYRSAARPGEVVMTRRWRRPIHFALFFGPIALFALGMLIAVVASADLAALLAQFAFQGLLVSAVAMYVGLCGLVNSTRLELHDGMLRIAHGPLPWRKNVSWPSNDFVDVWTQHVHVADAPDMYRLRVQLKSAGELVLLDELPSLEDGVYLEEKIATKIGLGERG